MKIFSDTTTVTKGENRLVLDNTSSDNDSLEILDQADNLLKEPIICTKDTGNLVQDDARPIDADGFFSFDPFPYYCS